MDGSGYAARPDYRVDVLARRNRVTATVGGTVLADSERCLLVDEQDHGLVFYFPPEDVDLDVLEPDDRTSVCPYKGLASYRRLTTVDGQGQEIEVLAWSYAEPHPEVARIAGYWAFFQDVVTVRVGTAVPPVSGR